MSAGRAGEHTTSLKSARYRSRTAFTVAFTGLETRNAFLAGPCHTCECLSGWNSPSVACMPAAWDQDSACRTRM